jgi:AcrR family transcriptional regulator
MARHREFDEAEVLDRAMDVFWCLGYEGASIAELTRAMGLTSPSIYAAFGNKRGLFDAVLRRYRDRRMAFKDWAFSGSTAREVAERVLLGAAEWLVDPNEPLGCLSVQAGVSAGVDNLEVPKQLTAVRRQLEISMRDRFERAKADGDLGEEIDPAALARYIQTVFLGMSLQAAGGSTGAELADVARRALLAWPAS